MHWPINSWQFPSVLHLWVVSSVFLLKVHHLNYPQTRFLNRKNNLDCNRFSVCLFSSSKTEAIRIFHKHPIQMFSFKTDVLLDNPFKNKANAISTTLIYLCNYWWTISLQMNKNSNNYETNLIYQMNEKYLLQRF